MFSHYKYYDDVFDKLMGDEYQMNMRECWVRMFDTWVPYPFQNNIRYLNPDTRWKCLQGLIRLYKQPFQGKPGPWRGGTRSASCGDGSSAACGRSRSVRRPSS